MPVHFVAACDLPTEFGKFVMHGFEDPDTGQEHVALTFGKVAEEQGVLCRVHSECLTGDAFSSLRCDCGPQLDAAMAAIVENGWGCLLYLRQEGRGIGLHAKIQAYHLQDRGADTLDANLMLGHPADKRDYEIAATMLSNLDIKSVALLTNNPDKVKQLESHGITVARKVPLIAGIGDENVGYLQTKIRRMGHMIDSSELE